MPSSEPKPVPRMIDQNEVRRSARVGSTLPMRVVNTSLLILVLQVEHHVGDAEERHGERHEAEPVAELGQAEGEADDAGIHVGADEAEQDAEAHHGDGLDERAARQHNRGDETEHHQREIIRRTELERELGERRREEGDHQRRDAAGDEGADGRDPERGPGAAVARHLVAVERGDDGGRLARNVDQDRGGRAAVLGAVIDAGEHDQGGRRVEPEGERQQHRHRRHRPDPRQHADQRAEKAADEAIERVLPGERDAETESEIGQRFHCRPLRLLRHNGSGNPSSQTKTATENSIIAAASTMVSSGRTSRAA